jgi:hypothetical protein
LLTVLASWILLLLTGPLPTTLLLLARFLAGVLTLLAGVLVLTAHLRSPLRRSQRANRGTAQPLHEICRFRPDPSVARMCRCRGKWNTAPKEGVTSPHLWHRTLLPPLVPYC